jgi:hypothetical protein
VITEPTEATIEQRRLHRETNLRALRGTVLGALALAQSLDLESVMDLLLAAQVAVVRAADDMEGE